MKPHDDIGTMKDIMIERLRASGRLIKEAVELYQYAKQEKGPFNSSINRSYYAIFKAISAVHAIEGNTFRKHKEAIGMFNKDYIHTGTFPKSYGKEIHQAENRRNASDYDDFYIATAEEAAEQIQFATQFLEDVKSYCSTIIEENVDTIIKNREKNYREEK